MLADGNGRHVICPSRNFMLHYGRRANCRTHRFSISLPPTTPRSARSPRLRWPGRKVGTAFDDLVRRRKQRLGTPDRFDPIPRRLRPSSLFVQWLRLQQRCHGHGRKGLGTWRPNPALDRSRGPGQCNGKRSELLDVLVVPACHLGGHFIPFAILTMLLLKRCAR